MRRFLYLIFIFAYLLTACGGNTEALPTPDSGGQTSGRPTPFPPDVATSLALTNPAPTPVFERQRIYATGQPTLPPLGVLIPPATEDPDAALVFDTLLFERTGGPEGVPLNIEIRSDGAIARDGQAGTISIDAVNQIDAMLDHMGFFGMGGVFSSPGTSNQLYTYRITVNRQGASRTITAQDGYLPAEITQLVAVLSQVGLG
jgi:hypothetical protein